MTLHTSLLQFSCAPWLCHLHCMISVIRWSSILSLEEGVFRGPRSSLIFHSVVLLEDKQEISMGELINLKFDPFSTLILPLFSYNLSTNLSKKGVEYTFLTYYALSCPISWSAGLRSRKWEFLACFAKKGRLGINFRHERSIDEARENLQEAHGWLQEAHGQLQDTHGRASKPEAAHGWTHDRASEPCLPQTRTGARA